MPQNAYILDVSVDIFFAKIQESITVSLVDVTEACTIAGEPWIWSFQ